MTRFVGRIFLVLALSSAFVALGTTASSGAETAMCRGFPATIVGTDGADRIEGTPGRDIIVGLAGKDVIFGRDGNDVICGGAGNDVIKGGRGNDYSEGNQGNDKLIGGIGRDTLDGGNAKDRLFGGGGPDTLIGGGKRDIVFGEVETDTCDLDRLDFFAGCEDGDVLGVTGIGATTFDTFNDPDSDWSLLDPFLLSLDAPPEAPPGAGFPAFVVEFYFETDPEAGIVDLTIYDVSGDILTFFLSDEPFGTVRLATLDVPGEVEILGVGYFEWLLVKSDLLKRRPPTTNANLPDVFRVDPSIPGEVDYTLTFDPQVGAWIDFFPGPVGESNFDFSSDDASPLVGTIPNGAWVVAIDAEDWALTLEPAA